MLSPCLPRSLPLQIRMILAALQFPMRSAVQELHITAVLFGSLVRRRLVAGGALATALRCVAEVRTNLESPLLALCHVCEFESMFHLRHLSLILSWWCHKRTKHLCCIDETGNDKDMFPVQAARSPPGSKLSRFALDALAQFRDELSSWPDFCATLLQVGITVARCRTRAITMSLRLCQLWCLLPNHSTRGSNTGPELCLECVQLHSHSRLNFTMMKRSRF